eukprot:UN14559
MEDRTAAMRLENDRLAREREDYQAELLTSKAELKKITDKHKVLEEQQKHSIDEVRT